MFRKFGEMLRRLMYGRYGTDQLNLALLISSIAVSLLRVLLSLFFGGFPVYGLIISPLLQLLTMGLLAYYCFRAFSRNIYARQKENRWFRQLGSRLQDKKNRYYRCPKCKQTVRVPKGKGKISIRCPKCGERFIRKT